MEESSNEKGEIGFASAITIAASAITIAAITQSEAKPLISFFGRVAIKGKILETGEIGIHTITTTYSRTATTLQLHGGVEGEGVVGFWFRFYHRSDFLAGKILMTLQVFKLEDVTPAPPKL